MGLIIIMALQGNIDEIEVLVVKEEGLGNKGWFCLGCAMFLQCPPETGKSLSPEGNEISYVGLILRFVHLAFDKTG